jgi:hypothetical protein
MSRTLAEVREETLYRLGDEDSKIWTGDEIDAYLKEAYGEMAIRTLCFWDSATLEDVPYTANYNGSWEKSYFSSGQVVHGQFDHTEEWESSYVTSGLEPGNHTSIFEWGYLSKKYISALNDVPVSLYQMERAVWGNIRLEPLTQKELRNDPNYETTTGIPIAYMMQQEGIRKFRKYPRAVDASSQYSYVGTYGILRNPADISSETPTGTFGPLRMITGELVSPSLYAWGLARTVTQSSQTTRIEFFRRGSAVVSDNDAFELPDLYVKYLRHFAMHKAMEREGTGQDTKLSDHYRQRFDVGIARMKRRISSVLAQRVRVIGGSDTRGQRPPKPRLPYQYGTVQR